jgi:hypothetical protein
MFQDRSKTTVARDVEALEASFPQAEKVSAENGRKRAEKVSGQKKCQNYFSCQGPIVVVGG